MSNAYYELAANSNFSFLHGASHAEELVERAAELGISGIAICDRNSLAGIVRGHMAAKEAQIKFAVGCRLVFLSATPDVLVWPKTRCGYGNLCQLLTNGKRRAPKGECHLTIDDLLQLGDDLLVAVIPNQHLKTAETLSALSGTLEQLSKRFSSDVYLAISRNFNVHDERNMAKISRLAKKQKVKPIAIGDVLYHIAERRHLQDVLTCIKEHKTLQTIGALSEQNAERHLRTPKEMLRLFKGYEQAIFTTQKLFEKINFSLDELRYQYPQDPLFAELDNQPLSSQTSLEKLTAIGLKRRYPNGAPRKVLDAISHEMQLIKKVDYAPYFLTVYDIVRFARSKKILCQGRGSAANSAVCYCLGITEVDPSKVDLLFERFISEERNEPPDIDVDFEHERREEVIQYIYDKYGRENSGIAATVVTYRSRSALREVGKVFGLSDDAITAISKTKWGSSKSVDQKDVARAGLDVGDKHLMQMLSLAEQIIGFPRHLSQHVGGFVITRDKLSTLIPIENAAMENRTIVEWDKDDLESLGMLKIDVLALGMLTCIRKAFDLLKIHYSRQETLSSLPDGDTSTYDMICRADTVGVFQIESRAQMSMLPRLRPRNYYDLVIEVAIVRPGPIQGDMVHPYLRRRQGKEQVEYPKEELRDVLGKTLGVPLFQEQAMNIAIIAGGFTPSEADKLRRAMATFKRVGTIGSFQRKMTEGMVKNGYEHEFAEHCFKQIEGFGNYGFPESHAASFALLVYVSCWLKCHYPDVFCAAILNSQPMGFYAPAQLIRDAREHGVEMRAVDVNHSDWISTLEIQSEEEGKSQKISPQHQSMKNIMKHQHAVRLGLQRVKGFGEKEAELLIKNRDKGYDSIRDLWMRSGLTRKSIESLAQADCFRSIGMDRRAALWAVKALDPLSSAERLPLFASADHHNLQKEPEVNLPTMALGEQVINDYQSLSFSLKAHPIAFLRKQISKQRYIKNVDLLSTRSGRYVQVAGLVLIRQRPGTAKGVVFETIEDETGIANIIIWPKVFEKYRAIVLGSRCVGISGKMQSHDGVTHVIAQRLEDLTPLMAQISDMADHMGGLANADEVIKPQHETRNKIKSNSELVRLLREVPEVKQDYIDLALEKKVVNAMPKGRNFH